MIRVHHNYGGKLTGEQRIEAGDYAADDARLFGLADYLVTNGHAAVIENEPPPVETIEATVHPAAVESAEKPKRGRGK